MRNGDLVDVDAFCLFVCLFVCLLVCSNRKNVLFFIFYFYFFYFYYYYYFLQGQFCILLPGNVCLR